MGGTGYMCRHREDATASLDAARSLFARTKIFGSLDGLRCLAILAVIWSHSGIPGPAWLGSLPVRGGFGVDLFFCISGFLICTLLLRERAATGTVSLRNFYMRRALRIFPLYFAVLGTYIVLLAAAGPDKPGAEQFWRELPYLLTYTHNWVDPFFTQHGIFAIAWSLATEEQFYTVWPLLLLLAPRAVQLAALALVIGLDIAFSFPSVIPPLEEQPFYLRFFAGLSTPICLGVLLALAMNSPAGFAVVYRATGWRGAALVYMGVLLAILTVSGRLPPAAWNCLAWLAAIGLVAACTVREDNALAGTLTLKPVAWIGVVSYGLYLLHPLATSVAVRVLDRMGLESEPGPIRFVAVVICSCLAAAASYYWFESRFLRLKKRFESKPEGAVRRARIEPLEEKAPLGAAAR